MPKTNRHFVYNRSEAGQARLRRYEEGRTGRRVRLYNGPTLILDVTLASTEAAKELRMAHRAKRRARRAKVTA